MLNSSEENTGLPCPDCGKKQQTMNCQFDPDRAGLNIRISVRLLRADVAKEIRGLCTLLKMLAKGAKL